MNATRRIGLSASMLAAMLALAAGATAAGPEITRFSFQDSYVDTQTCPGILIQTQLEAHVSVRVFSETRVQVKQQLIYTASANGKTVTDNETFTEFVNPESGVHRFAGTTINIQIPGYGRVLADTGVITVDFSTDPPTVIHEGGPHPLFHDGYGPLCQYLAN